MDTCAFCGRSLEGGELTLPWEDGDNPNAYVTCPHCRGENIRYGFGEDDDLQQGEKGGQSPPYRLSIISKTNATWCGRNKHEK